jgi:hypothetical protein
MFLICQIIKPTVIRMAGDVFCKSSSFEQEWGKNRPKYKYFFNPNYAAQKSWNDIMLENFIIEKSLWVICT